MTGPYAGEDAPCRPAVGGEWEPGWTPCTLDFGLCVVCGRAQGLPWLSMSHELYGAYWLADRGRQARNQVAKR